MQAMYRIVSVIVIFATAFLTLFSSPAFAGDATKGATVFSANCAACHIGGGNAVNAQKTLKIEDLKQYGKDSIEAIKTQVTNGNGAMPASGGRLTPEQIEDVATYVLNQSEAGW